MQITPSYCLREQTFVLEKFIMGLYDSNYQMTEVKVQLSGESLIIRVELQTPMK